MAGPKPDSSNAPEGFIAKFTVLKSAPRELWIIYWCKVMEVAAYGLINMGIMLYLINDLQLGDEGAGSFVAFWAILISLFTVIAGSLSDAMGVRKTLMVAFLICVVTRILAAVIGDPILSPLLAFVPMAAGVGMTIPVMVAATRRYTTKAQSSMAFSLLYVLMNVGFIISGWLFDEVRVWMGKDGIFEIAGLQFSLYETIFLLAAAFTVLGLAPVMFLMRKGVEMPDEGDEPIIDPAAEATVEGGPFKVMRETLVKTGKIFGSVVSEKTFWRFMLLLALVVGVRMVFYQMHFTLPPWADREMGFGSRFGKAWGVLNPALICILAPIFGALGNRISSYTVIVVGTTLSAVPCILLALPIDTFAFLLDTPVATVIKGFLSIDGDLSPLYFNLIFFAILFSIGEALWSPRLYEYTASVAPKGKEATYMSMSLLPMFVGKMTVGALSGFLLANYCPAEGGRNSAILWLVVAGMAVATPVFIVLLRGIIRPKSRDDEEKEAGEPVEQGAAS